MCSFALIVRELEFLNYFSRLNLIKKQRKIKYRGGKLCHFNSFQSNIKEPASNNNGTDGE
jgi:hypothetical protein